MTASGKNPDEQGAERKPAQEVTEHLARNRSWLRSVVVARLGTSEGVDDVMQEVSVAAVNQQNVLQSVESIPAWLYQVAVRQSLLFRRSLGRHRRKLIAATSNGQHPEPIVPPLEQMLRTERQTLVQDALKLISRSDRELLLLKHVEDWSYEQIAEHLGRTPKSVESGLHRAREKFRRQLQRLKLGEEEL